MTTPVRIETWQHKGPERRAGRDERGYAWLRTVVEPELRDAMVGEADRQKVTLSEVIRRACRAYVDKP